MEAAFRIKNIGERSGKLLFFGGVYGNLQALQAMQHVTFEMGIPPSNVFFTGDVVGYCAQPAECCALIKDWGIHAIAGNVEIQLREDAEDCGCDFSNGGRCDLLSKNWYAFTKKNIGAAALAWISDLPEKIYFRYAGNDCIVLHGSFLETSKYIFQSTLWSEKMKCFKAADAEIIIAGHSGLPFVEVHNAECWLNAGVIGMPANDGDTRVWYATLEAEESGDVVASLHQLQYDYERAASLMLAAGLPQQYALTLGTGIWDNCEILPEAETLAQGKKIEPSVHKIRGR